jgi:hypothetical protein
VEEQVGQMPKFGIFKAVVVLVVSVLAYLVQLREVIVLPKYYIVYKQELQ